MSEALSTVKNVAAIKETFDLSVFHPADSYNHLMKLNNWDCKEIAARFEGILYKNKRTFAKEIIQLAEYVKEKNL